MLLLFYCHLLIKVFVIYDLKGCNHGLFFFLIVDLFIHIFKKPQQNPTKPGSLPIGIFKFKDYYGTLTIPFHSYGTFSLCRGLLDEKKC